MTGECTLCQQPSSEMTHLKLVVDNNETWACFPCRMVLTEVAKGLKKRCFAIKHKTELTEVKNEI